MRRLTASPRGAQNPRQVLNTPLLAVSAPDSLGGFFTAIGFSMAGSAQSYNSLRAKAASGLVAVLKYPPPLSGVVLSTKLLGAIMANQNQPDASGQAGETLSFRIPLFKVLEALHFASAKARARAALQRALDLAGADEGLVDALRSLSLAARQFGTVAMIFNSTTTGGLK